MARHRRAAGRDLLLQLHGDLVRRRHVPRRARAGVVLAVRRLPGVLPASRRRADRAGERAPAAARVAARPAPRRHLARVRPHRQRALPEGGDREPPRDAHRRRGLRGAERHSSLEVLVAIYGYAVQIFADFCGYTNIAIGIALLLGFVFPQNFDSPYAAVSLQDFWRRWHMTLSRWLRDYLYIPLGGNRKGRIATYRNLMLTMLLGGLWHGAAWTFVDLGRDPRRRSLRRARARLAPDVAARAVVRADPDVPDRLLRVDVLPRRLARTCRPDPRAALHRVGPVLAARHHLGPPRDRGRHRRSVRPAERRRRRRPRLRPHADARAGELHRRRASRSSRPSAPSASLPSSTSGSDGTHRCLARDRRPLGRARDRGRARRGGPAQAGARSSRRASSGGSRSRVTRPLVDVSRTLHLTTPRHELQVAIGREGEDRIDTAGASEPSPPATTFAPAAAHAPPRRARPVFTPEHPLRVWTAGDSLAAVPGQALAAARRRDRRGRRREPALDGPRAPRSLQLVLAHPGGARAAAPRVVVFSFGADDAHDYMARRPGGKTVGPLGSPSWSAEYRRRVDGVTRELNAKGIHVVWLGLPIPAGRGFAHSFPVVNRDPRVGRARPPGGRTYVDTWSLLANSRGRYTAYLRVHGRLTLMRLPDGVPLHRGCGRPHRAAAPASSSPPSTTSGARGAGDAAS